MKFLIFEDDELESLTLKIKLNELGYTDLLFLENPNNAEKQIQNDNIQLVISDIYFNGTPKGLEIVDLCQKYNKPVIAITNMPHYNNISKIEKKTKVFYIIKPFHKFSLKSVIDNALYINDLTSSDAEFIYLKNDNNESEKVFFNEIIYIESQRNNINVHTIRKEQYILRSSLKQFNQNLISGFVQIHQAFIVNENFILKISANNLLIKDATLPIGRKFKANLEGVINKRG